ncbi:uncharacterized protein PAN0_009c3830 [Moesziomyces antarcticus]|uniref:Uncharacterized protein n=2 Tax=Pseudozyma antarctica TaxID=84753 RepID=A0A5C3FSQ7_PSEA2|nr:uncharacterized protein PAN0_009c3830 [Moesziomyces antarcticus]GAK65612.1 conserved hypothetical protein [Moesziomyces antarcticus]SPO46627.1 uncharacterized protein PSANT_04313 [Moesziomyces antarcticus]
MASASAHPELSQPVSLLAHPSAAPAELARHAALPATGFSSTKCSTVSTGAAYKLSSDARTLRRLKGTLPILVAANALNLVNPQTQTPIQSFTLSSADTASSAPLTLLSSLGAGRSLRTTYVGIESHKRSKSGRAAVAASHELWAFVEELSAKSKENAEVQFKKEVLPLDKPVRLIHPLSDGRLVLTHPDDSLTLVSSSPITFDDEASVQTASTSMQVVQTIDATNGAGHQRSHFYVNILDAPSAKALVSHSSQIEEAALLGLRIAVTSDYILASTSAKAGDDSKKKKRSKRSKKDASSKPSAKDAQDDDDVAASSGHLPAKGAPSGPLTLELTAFVKSFDGASDAMAALVKLGRIEVPGFTSARHVQDVHFHSAGRLALLGIDGQLTSFKLSTSSSAEPVLVRSGASLLPALAPASNARPSSSSTASPACCLLLSRDHALVVGVTRATPATQDKERIAALIVDVELGAVLREIDWAVPFVAPSSAAASTLGLLQRMTTISATRIAGSTSVITIGAPTVAARISDSSANAEALLQLQQRRLCVLSMPFVVPEASVLRDALGKGDLTARWIQTAATDAADAAGVSASDASRADVLDQIKRISQATGNAKAKGAEINTLISQWIEASTADGRMVETMSAPEADTAFFGELLDVLLPAPSSRKGSASGLTASAALVTMLKHARVHPSVFASLQPTAGSTAANGAVASPSNAARLSEFWARIGSSNEPKLVRAAIERLPEVSEETLVSLLMTAVRGLSASSASKAAAGFMALVVELVEVPVSRAALRSALKTQLRDDVESVVALLQMCNAWISQTIQLPLQVVERGDDSKMPKAEAAMALATDVLDTFFPLLLTTPRTHATVEALSATIGRYVQLMSTLRLVNAPLSAFAKLQQENALLSEAASRDKKSSKRGTSLAASGAMASAGNAKVHASSKAEATARAEMGGGLGLKLGTMGEAKTRRLQLLEQSMLVGAYSFERLEI